MRNPIILKSEIEFVVVGPIYDTDGIYICSENIDMSLIGYAHKLYRTPNKMYENPNLQYALERKGIGYSWSDIPSIDNSRKSKVLLCWKLSDKISMYEKAVRQEKQGLVKKEFEDFVQNSYSFISEFSDRKTTIDTINKLSKKYKSSIMWKISPLLLQCSLPKVKI